ncbi:MAG: hypothetical protein ACRDGR_09315 [bacterium]
MSRHFRTLVISLAVASCMSGAAVAGPKDNGDPEIPTSPHRLRPTNTGAERGRSENCVQVQVAAGATASERSGLWMRFLRTYLRLVRIVGP